MLMPYPLFRYDVYLPKQSSIYGRNRELSSMLTNGVAMLGVLVGTTLLVRYSPNIHFHLSDLYRHGFTDLFSGRSAAGLAMLVNTCGAFVAYRTALLACRLRIQLVAFAMPIITSLALAMVAAGIFCWFA